MEKVGIYIRLGTPGFGGIMRRQEDGQWLGSNQRYGKLDCQFRRPADRTVALLRVLNNAAGELNRANEEKSHGSA
jgi:hypothetical protein